MKRLESVKLVQFFLYEQTEISLSEITGLFGQNGGGKSAILDAIQVAVFGGNSNLTAFNAQADDKTKTDRSATTRSLRDYCLGQYGSATEQRIRDHATTYITLVWRDTDTKESLSMGICVYASSECETPTVLGRYVIRGVELAMIDHLETVDGRTRPRDWKGFRHQLRERSRVTGDEPIFDDARRYIMAALTALRGGGGTPAYEAFTRAFRFALRMRFAKSVDQIVRDDVLEARPTNVRKFRELTDTFSKLSNMVAYVEKKMADGSRVVEGFAATMAEARRAVTWKGLSASAKHTRLAEAHDAMSVKCDEAEAALEECKAQADGVLKIRQNLEQELEHQKILQLAHTAHMNNAQVQADRFDAENRVRSRRSSLDQYLGDMRRLLKGSADDKLVKDYRTEMLDLAETIHVIVRNTDSLSRQDAEKAARRTSKLASRIVSHLFETQRTIAAQMATMEAELRDTDESLKRARLGRPSLSQPTQRLMTELGDHGLTPTPICDLVRITDPDWQPAIEAYLRKNVEALLVNGSDEERAFQIYRGLDGGRAVYGVKIAMASKQISRGLPVPGSVAELVEGSDPAAVAYVRHQLGDLRRAAETRDALSGGRALTKDGMLVGRGEFERLKLVPADELKIGAGGGGQVDSLEDFLKRLRRHLATLEGDKGQVESLREIMTTIGGDHTVQLVTSAVDNLREAINDCETATKRSVEVGDAEYQAICDGIAVLSGNLPAARDSEQKAHGDVIRAEAALSTALGEKEKAIELLDQVAREVETFRADADYDKLFASEQWDRLLSQFGEDYEGMSTHCSKQSEESSGRVVRLASKSSGLFGTYLSDYREAPGHEICEDWRQAATWMGEQVKRLHDTELMEHKERAEEAYRASQETFRADVAIALSNNLDALNDTFERLNAALKHCPVFSNGERYQFVRSVRPNLKPLLKFVKDVAAYGAVGDMLGDPGDVPHEFEALLREKVTPGAGAVRSPLDDYREFFEFDIRIDREDPVTGESKSVGMLSKRLGTGSGGEHRAPLYVIAGAALSSAYRLDKSNRDGLRLILLDEAFDKMDMTNIIATMRYLDQLGLQILMASPGENLATLNAFLHRYYDIQRDVDLNVIHLEKRDVSEEMRQLFREDLPEFNQDLLERELAAIRNPGGGEPGISQAA